MNYEETKLTEALAICAGDDCDGCPYYDFHQCYNQVKRGARKLIIKQDRTIERLKDDYAKLQKLFAQYQMASDKEIRAQVKQAKIDVLNELKEKTYVNDYCREVVEVEKIDELIKELIKNDNTRND